MSQRMMNRFEELGTLWCRLNHNAALWPSHGHYQCAKCHRQYPVPWEKVEEAPAQSRRVMQSVTAAAH